eukprot:3053965-Rhodomonas_salina.1
MGAYLRWVRMMKDSFRGFVATNLMARWGQGSLKVCVDEWKKSGLARLKKRTWVPDDILITSVVSQGWHGFHSCVLDEPLQMKQPVDEDNNPLFVDAVKPPPNASLTCASALRWNPLRHSRTRQQVIFKLSHPKHEANRGSRLSIQVAPVSTTEELEIRTGLMTYRRWHKRFLETAHNASKVTANPSNILLSIGPASAYTEQLKPDAKQRSAGAKTLSVCCKRHLNQRSHRRFLARALPLAATMQFYSRSRFLPRLRQRRRRIAAALMMQKLARGFVTRRTTERFKLEMLKKRHKRLLSTFLAETRASMERYPLAGYQVTGHGDKSWRSALLSQWETLAQDLVGMTVEVASWSTYPTSKATKGKCFTRSKPARTAMIVRLLPLNQRNKTTPCVDCAGKGAMVERVRVRYFKGAGLPAVVSTSELIVCKMPARGCASRRLKPVRWDRLGAEDGSEHQNLHGDHSRQHELEGGCQARMHHLEHDNTGRHAREHAVRRDGSQTERTHSQAAHDSNASVSSRSFLVPRLQLPGQQDGSDVVPGPHQHHQHRH